MRVDRSDLRKLVTWQDALFLVLFIGALILSVWKSRYGFGGDDEAFYLTIPHRLSLGDALFRDEWHVSQLSGFLLLPFVALYRAIFQSTDGIIMAARFLYIILHGAVSVFLYVRTRKYGVMAAAASVLYFIFTPFDIMALSYNTMGLDLVTVTGVLIATSDHTRRLPLIISGVAFAGAVLCCPYLLCAYALGGLFAAGYALVRRYILKSGPDPFFPLTRFLWFTAGAALMAAVFLAFLFSRTSLSDIFENLPSILSDPGHPDHSVFSRLPGYFSAILNCAPGFSAGAAVYLVTAAVMLVDRQRQRRRFLYLCVSACVVLYAYFLYWPELTTVYYNALMFPLVFLGITSFILCRRKEIRLFLFLFGLGILYSMSVYLSSNTGFYAISMASSSANAASLLFLGQLLREMWADRDAPALRGRLERAAVLLAAAVVLAQGALQLKVKAGHCFWEDETPAGLTCRIEDGPARGIWTDLPKQTAYQRVYQDLQYYAGREPGNFLCLAAGTWPYLAVNDYPYGTCSAWLSGLPELEEFYAMHPAKIPKYIYISKFKARWDADEIRRGAREHGYAVTENDAGYKLEKAGLP